MGSQNCSFHWINLLFLKIPPREDDSEYDSETEGGGTDGRDTDSMWDCVSFNLVLGLRVNIFICGDFTFHPCVCVCAVCYKTVKHKEP